MKKLVNAFKEFEITKDKAAINGGAKIIWRGTIGGVECCDVDYEVPGVPHVCGIPDKGWLVRSVTTSTLN